MGWIYLVIAGLLEIGWALGLKVSEGLSRPLPAVLTAVTMIASFVVLAQAVKMIPIGTAYPVWTGIGAAGTAIFGMIYFGESRDALRIACIGLILLGTLGLKFLAQKG